MGEGYHQRGPSMKVLVLFLTVLLAVVAGLGMTGNIQEGSIVTKVTGEPLLILWVLLAILFVIVSLRIPDIVAAIRSPKIEG